MAESIKISLDTSKYQAPAQDDITAAKQFILEREEYAGMLSDRIDEELADAAAKIVIICYTYGFEPKKLLFSSAFNGEMMAEISEVMDSLEKTILRLIYEYSTRNARNSGAVRAISAWMATLGRGNRNLEDTLHGYLHKTMKDWEAAIAAMKYTGTENTDAVTKIRTYLHSIYTMPDVLASFRRRNEFAATYINSGGVQKGAVGLSSNGSTNVTNMARTTLQMAWMHSQAMNLHEQGAAGLYVLRGSSFPCTPCDDNCGFHPIADAYDILPVHPNCCCFAVPIFTK